jgi:hypothetical protein
LREERREFKDKRAEGGLKQEMRHERLIVILFIVSLAVLMGIPYTKWTSSAVQKACPVVGAGPATPILHPSGKNKVIMIIVDQMDLNDLTGLPLPNFKKLTEGGALALMNCNTAGSNMASENTYATIGAGSHILATGTSPLGFNSGDKLETGPAAVEYKRRTGRTAPLNSLVHLGIVRIQQQNSRLPYPALPGALGTVLHDAGLKTAVLGNADTVLGLKRQALSIAMDKYGMVDLGNVGQEMLAKDDEFPNELRTNYGRLLIELDRLPEDAALTVIDTGDLSRLDESRQYVFDAVWQAERQRTMQRLDQFLGEVIDRLDLNRDLLLVLSPTPVRETGIQTAYLTPVVVMGAGVEKGFLFSPATKRQGIILNTDIAPTILHFLSLEMPDRMTGQPVQAVKGDNQLKILQAMHNQLALTYIARPSLQKGYVIYQLCLLLACLCFILSRRNQVARILQPFLLSVMAVPLVYLLLPLLPQPSLLVLTVELVILTLGITFLACACERRHYLGSFVFLSLVTAGLILIDTLAGAPLQKTAIMSYDPLVGARFYGIGNEYMGVLVGSLIIGCTTLLNMFSRYRKVLLFLTGIIFLLTIYILASSRLGSNMGGAIASSAALLTTFLLLCKIKFKLRTVLGLVAAIVSLVIISLAIDLKRSAGLQSHFGRNAALILAGGWTEILNIIIRKTEMNLKLIKYTLWSRIFIASLGSLALLFYRPVGVMAVIRNRYPDLYRGFIGVIVGSIVALVFNDSGVVAAATTMIFGAPPIIYLVLQEQK